jgi:N-acetylneuraminate synthase
MVKDINIAGHTVGHGKEPFYVAELSGNHNHDIDRALKIIDAAAKAGAHAVKFQTYTPDTMTLDVDGPDFTINDPSSLWHGYTLYKLYEEAHTPWDWFETLIKRCEENNLIWFSSPFDQTSVDFLEDLSCPCYKIASTENTDIRLLKAVAKTKKPVILSTGMATLEELALAVETLKSNGCDQLILLKCTAAYPADPKDANLATLNHMAELFDCQVGLSDHSLGITVPVASVVLGAIVIEKHITLDRSAGGVDDAFSLEPNEFADMVEACGNARNAIGAIKYGPVKSENNGMSRRSLYIKKDISKGEVLTADHVAIIRPGMGLESKYYDIILGQTVTKDCRKGDRISWSTLKS